MKNFYRKGRHISFTAVVNPFRYKFGDIARKKENESLMFILANVGGYGGSGIFYY